MKVCVCITCSARNSMYIRFTAPTPTHVEHSADAETSAQSSIVLCVEPDSKQHMLECCDRAGADTVLFPFVFVLVCVSLHSCAVCIVQERGKKMGHHSEGNIHALRLTTGSVCVHSWLGSWCVCCVAPGCLGSIPFLCMPERGQFPR